MSKSQPSTIFMTGATGFLGHFVLRDLLLRGRRMVVLLRAPLAESSKRLHAMMRQLHGAEDQDIFETALADGRLILQEGALPDDLPDETWGKTDEVLACAASLQLFSNGNGEPFRTNVSGTEAIIDWARRHKVSRIHAVSTAYVCGQHNGEAREDFYRPPSGFQTEYERTKWLAEEMLKEWGREPGNILTILRPSFLIGDSQTGYTTQYGGFYQFARMLSILKDQYGDRPIPLRIPGHSNDPGQNFVPVDFASRIASEVVLDPSLHGRIYHLTDPEPPTLDGLKRLMEGYFGICGGHFVDCEKLTDESAAEALLWEKYEYFLPRIQHHIYFDQTNTRQVMSSRRIVFPPLNLERFGTLVTYAVSQRWGTKSRNGSNGAGRKQIQAH